MLAGWIVAFAVIMAVIVVIAGRRRGYPAGREVIVRCRQGHLFTTIWIPLASVKAVRLGLSRYQRCPVGNHWDLVRPVPGAELTEQEIQLARSRHDIPIP